MTDLRGLQKLHTHGATLAALVQHAVISDRDFDGLVFGHYITQSSVDYQDHAEAGVVHETQAVITGFLPCACSRSFYDNCGVVNAKTLQQLVLQHPGSDPVIGWLSCRPGDDLRPSMRELAVTDSLSQVLSTLPGRNPRHPALFALVNTSSKHNGATVGVQMKIIDATTYTSIPFSISNIGNSTGDAAYRSFVPRMPSLASNQQLSDQGPVPNLEHLAMNQSVAGLEGVYESFLHQLKGMCRQVESSSLALQQLQEENKRLLQMM